MNNAFTVSVNATAIGTGSLKDNVNGLGPLDVTKLSEGVPPKDERDDQLSDDGSAAAGKMTSSLNTRSQMNAMICDITV